MIDKTRLEHEIERHEIYRTPLSLRILIFLLLVSISFAGIYIFKLKQDILKKEQEIMLLKKNFQEERAKPLDKIKKSEPLEPDLNQSK